MIFKILEKVCTTFSNNFGESSISSFQVGDSFIEVVEIIIKIGRDECIEFLQNCY